MIKCDYSLAINTETRGLQKQRS